MHSTVMLFKNILNELSDGCDIGPSVLVCAPPLLDVELAVNVGHLYY